MVMKLSLEQEFSLISFTERVKHISREQAEALLVEQHRLMMLRNTLFRQLLKQEWELDSDIGYP
jgi:hypothetical protein